MEQQRTALCGERQIAQFVDDHGIGVDQLACEIPTGSLLFFPIMFQDVV